MDNKVVDYRLLISEQELDDIIAGKRKMLLSLDTPPAGFDESAMFIGMDRYMRTISIYANNWFVGVVLLKRCHVWKYNGVYPVSSSFMYEISPQELSLLNMTYSEFEAFGKERTVYGYEFDTFKLDKNLIGTPRPPEKETFIPVVL